MAISYVRDSARSMLVLRVVVAFVFYSGEDEDCREPIRSVVESVFESVFESVVESVVGFVYCSDDCIAPWSPRLLVRVITSSHSLFVSFGAGPATCKRVWHYYRPENGS